jgi:uncharacterized Tic20 family protein
MSPAEEKQMSLLTHLLSIFFGFVPAIIFFVLYRDRGPFVRNHVVTEWNFQLTALIVQVVCVGIALVGSFSSFASAAPDGGAPTGLIPFFIGYGLTWVIMIIRVIFGIIASVAANRGRFYRYPLAFRFVKE